MFNYEQINHIYQVAKLLAPERKEEATRTLLSSLVNLALQDENIATLCLDIDARWAEGKLPAPTAQALKALLQSINELEPEEQALLPKKESQKALAQQRMLANKRANALRYANKLRRLPVEDIKAPPQMGKTEEETHVPDATTAHV